MNRPIPAALAVMLAAAATLSAPDCLARHGGPNGKPADALTGSWTVQAIIHPCDGSGPPPREITALQTFHLGGTMTETNNFPLAGVPSPFGVSVRNGPGLGTWSYDPRTRVYTASFRFNWYVDGVYHGYQSIERQDITLSRDGRSFQSVVDARRYAHDPVTGEDELIAVFCGESWGERY